MATVSPEISSAAELPKRRRLTMDQTKDLNEDEHNDTICTRTQLPDEFPPTLDVEDLAEGRQQRVITSAIRMGRSVFQQHTLR
jgi:hypothetical protein